MKLFMDSCHMNHSAPNACAAFAMSVSLLMMDAKVLVSIILLFITVLALGIVLVSPQPHTPTKRLKIGA